MKRRRGSRYSRNLSAGKRKYARRVPPRKAARFRNVNPRTGGFLGIETKFYDTSLAGSALVAPGDAAGAERDQSATIGPTTITQGDGEQQRDGRKAMIKSCYVTGNVIIPSTINLTAAAEGMLIYIALVQDKQTNGALLNSEDVFTNDNGSGTLAANPLRNLQFSSRFQVLDRVQFAMPQPVMVYDGTNIEGGGMYKPFKLSWRGNMPMTFNGTTESIANSVDNSLHIIAYASDITLTPVISYQCRVRFVG